MGVSDLEMYEIGCQDPLDCSWLRTPPNPKDEASADTFVLAAVLKRARIHGELSSALVSAKACCWLGPHTHWFFWIVSHAKVWS